MSLASSLRTALAVALVTGFIIGRVAVEPPQDANRERAKTVRSIDELLLFFPDKHPSGDWHPAGLRFEDLWCTAADGTRIHGWYCPCDHPRATLLIAHGNGGNIAWRAPLLKYFQSQMRISTYMFDYRGYGRSEGVPTVAGVLQDTRAARSQLAKRAGMAESEVLLMGESLGGAIVVQIAAESAPRGLILQSTFSSLRDVASVHYPKLAWLVPATKLDSVSQISHYRGPLFQIHGSVDQIIPLALGEKLFQAANEPKTFVKISGADHNDGLSVDCLRQLDRFITNIERQTP